MKSLQEAAGLQELCMSVLIAWVKQEDTDLVLSARQKDEQSPTTWAQIMHTNHRHSSAWAWQFLRLWSHFVALVPQTLLLTQMEDFGWAIGQIVLMAFCHWIHVSVWASWGFPGRYALLSWNQMRGSEWSPRGSQLQNVPPTANPRAPGHSAQHRAIGRYQCLKRINILPSSPQLHFPGPFTRARAQQGRGPRVAVTQTSASSYLRIFL